MVKRPYLKGFCEDCANCYLLEGDEARCRKIKFGTSDVMCVQVVRCDIFETKVGEPDA